MAAIRNHLNRRDERHGTLSLVLGNVSHFDMSVTSVIHVVPSSEAEMETGVWRTSRLKVNDEGRTGR